MKHLVLPPYPDYELIDSGDGMKLERYGDFVIARPESQALWSPEQAEWNWDAYFDKSGGGQGRWTKIPNNVTDWAMSYGDLSWQCKWSPYRHVGVFPEQAMHWDWMRDVIRTSKQKNPTPPKVLNLFAYTGIASIACAKEGAQVTHVDASKPTIGWAQKNLALSGMPDDTIRWILEDVVKFVEREVRRGNTYDGIIMDPPVFGHGANGEKWEFDTSFPILLESIKKILSPNPLFFLVNTYASSIFSTSLANIVADILPEGIIEHGELGIQQKSSEKSLTTGVYARWKQK
jgi:23S rRNA (cytosine1962-C5)-methyltransferase